jgi:hypothetical protein
MAIATSGEELTVTLAVPVTPPVVARIVAFPAPSAVVSFACGRGVTPRRQSRIGG